MKVAKQRYKLFLYHDKNIFDLSYVTPRDYEITTRQTFMEKFRCVNNVVVMEEVKCFDDDKKPMDFFSKKADIWETIAIWLSKGPLVYKVKINEVIDLFPLAYRYLIISRISYMNLKRAEGDRFVLPLRYARFNTISGASDMVMTNEDLEAIMADESKLKHFFEGYLYRNQMWHYCAYQSHLLALQESHGFYTWSDNGFTMDCIIHSFNFLIGQPYFTCRE